MWKTESVHSSLMPIWFFRKLFGLHNPFMNHNTRKYRKAMLCFKIVYSAFFICSSCFIAYYEIFRKRNLPYSIMTKIEIFIKITARNITMIICIGISLAYQNKLVQMVRFIDKVDKNLEKYSMKLNYRAVNIFIASQLIFVVLQWFIYLIYNYFMCTKNMNSDCLYQSFLNNFISEKVGQIHTITFCTFVFMLRRQMKIINMVLENANSTKSTPISAHKLLDMKKTISNVVKMSSTLNSIFSLPLLAKFLQEFVKIFCTIHFRFSHDSGTGEDFAEETQLDSILGSLPLYDLLLVVLICETTYKEYTKTGNLILFLNETVRDRRTQTIVKKRAKLLMYNYHKDCFR